MSATDPRTIWCCACEADVVAQFAPGHLIYPHRPDLHQLPFWQCPTCRNYVGCHHKTPDPTRPLGCIPSPPVQAARRDVHRVLDPIWKSGLMKRSQIYRRLGAVVGAKQYHTAEIRSVEEARKIEQECRTIAEELGVPVP